MGEAGPEGWAKVEFDDSGWKGPEVGPKPPGGPWGNVPGLPPETRTEQAVCYRFALPPGTSRVSLPKELPVKAMFVGGKEMTAREGVADLKAVPLNERGLATVIVLGGEAMAPAVTCDCEPGQIALGSWTTQGFSRYSGVATYSRRVRLPKEYLGRPLILDLGDVGTVAEVSGPNGRTFGVRCMPPYQFDVTGLGKPGWDTLRIAVASTLATAQKENGAPAGLIGPVRLIPCERVEVRIP
jgi:hypothetical protein